MEVLIMALLYESTVLCIKLQSVVCARFKANPLGCFSNDNQLFHELKNAQILFLWQGSRDWGPKYCYNIRVGSDPILLSMLTGAQLLICFLAGIY